MRSRSAPCRDPGKSPPVQDTFQLMDPMKLARLQARNDGLVGARFYAETHGKRELWEADTGLMGDLIGRAYFLAHRVPAPSDSTPWYLDRS